MNKIFITGGAGYIGVVLTKFLLKKGYFVTVLDTMYFTDNFLEKNNKNLRIIKGDIRDNDLIEKSCLGHDIFINLACISNDVSFDLNEKLSTTINLNAFEPMVIAAKKSGIKRFIYASTSSVYGLSNEKDVKEDHKLVPLTLYNKYKGLCEPLLFKHTDENFTGVIFRPATVCGFSPRMRFDLSVNILTNFAINKKFIKVFGGEQLRPNLHIKEYCNAVNLLMNSDKDKISNQIFNVGNENLKIIEIAEIVKKVVINKFENINELQIIKTPSDDKRSYHINSDKIKDILDFEPKLKVEDAVSEICDAFKNSMFLNSFDDDIYYNVKRLKNLNVV